MSVRLPFVIVSFGVLIVMGVALSSEPAQDKKPTVAEVRKKYANYPSKTLKIVEPVEFKDVGYFKDGGSILLHLRDANGKDYFFRTYMSSSGTLHYGNEKPGAKGQPLAEGGTEQKELYAVWLRWIAKNIPNADNFLASKELPKTALDAASVSLSFRAVERRIVVIAEKGTFPE